MEKLTRFLLIASAVLSLVRISLPDLETQPSANNIFDYLLLGLMIVPVVFLFKNAESGLRKALVACISVFWFSQMLGYALGNKFSITSITKITFSIALFVLLPQLTKNNKNFEVSARITFLGLLVLVSAQSLIGADDVALNNSALEIRHSLSYAAVGASLGLFFGYKRKVLRYLVLVLGLYLLLRLQVMTATIAAAVILIFSLGQKSKIRIWPALFLLPLIGYMALSSRESQYTGTLNLSNARIWGSGRVGAWMDGLNDFATRSFPEILFGSGSDSTFQFWGVWWWEPKDIHSDILKILLEFGLVSLIAFAVLCVIFARDTIQKSPLAVAFALGALVSSVISNGILERPYIALLWALAGSLAGVNNSASDPLRYRTFSRAFRK